MNTFADIIKKSFLEGFSGSNITTGTILVTMAVTCALALYIFVVYYLAVKKTFYSKTFNVSLAVIAVITAGIIMALQSNLIISLGMVGALSIVRFRTAVKDPMDLIFLFWSISIGITCGAGMYEIALISSLVITVLLFLLEMTPVGRVSLLLVVNASQETAEAEIMEIVNTYSKHAKVKSRNISLGGEPGAKILDMIIECKPESAKEGELLAAISAVKGVFGTSLIAHDGEVTI